MKKIFLNILVLTFIFNQNSIMTVEAKELSKGDVLKEIYFDKKETEQEQIEEECKRVRQRYKKIEDVEHTIESLNLEDIYVNCFFDEGTLTIQLTSEANSKEFNKYIVDNSISIKYVENSQEELLMCEELCNNVIDNIDTYNKKEQQALKTIKDYNTNFVDNCEDIYVSDMSEENIKILNNIFDTDIIRFVKEEPATPTTTSVQLGRGYYVATKVFTYKASIGYRAKMKKVSTGEVMYGFVTCGHIIKNAIYAGNPVYLDQELTKEIGTIKLITFNSDIACDYAFVQTNSNYTMSNTVYYNTSYGRTGNGTKISNIYATEDDLVDAQKAEATINKAGASSYLTSGKITLASAAVKLANVNLSKMVMTDLYSVKGDSGGIVYGYIKHNDKYCWAIIGTITGGGTERTFVQPAYRATNYYSTYKITPY